MTAAAAHITASLNTVFAPMDAQVLADSQKWAQGRITALAEFKASDEFRALRNDAAARYPRLFGIAGGKTWYALFTSGRDVADFVEKNCAAVAARRNAGITAKLIKAGVTEVVSESYTYTADGFDGVFVVQTDKGTKRVTVNTIHAGGYNIQCAHLRVLVKVK